MNIRHWLVGIAIFGGFASFITFAFRQGQQVKSDSDTKQHWIQSQGDGGLGGS
jgi:hypothetical protein